MAMDKNIYVENIHDIPTPRGKIELVERKGIGHPDSVADALAETVSRALCKMYMKEYGHVLHHNTDETQIAAGMAAPKFGGGCTKWQSDFRENYLQLATSLEASRVLIYANRY